MVLSQSLIFLFIMSLCIISMQNRISLYVISMQNRLAITQALEARRKWFELSTVVIIEGSSYQKFELSGVHFIFHGAFQRSLYFL